tara:strand:- start:2009 stop:2422 length:414 start_codon:yes stop_codon:yes gene_type:complete
MNKTIETSKPLKNVTEFFTEEKIKDIRKGVKKLTQRRKAEKQDIKQFITNKLGDYILLEEEEYKTIHVGQHLRYTANVYQGYDEKTKTTKRKCVYAVVKKVLKNNVFEVNGYKPKYENWKIDLNNKYKTILLYVKSS